MLGIGIILYSPYFHNLYVTGTLIGDNGVAAIANSLQLCWALRELRLGGDYPYVFLVVSLIFITQPNKQIIRLMITE